MSTTRNHVSAKSDFLHRAALFFEKPKRVTKTVRETIINREIAVATANNEVSHYSELVRAPMTLEAKDSVMHTMQIVPVPICAAFLGVMEDDIYRFKRNAGTGFGGIYCQSLCFSINEVRTFARNRHWFQRPDGSRYPAGFSMPPVSFLIDGTFVSKPLLLCYVATDQDVENEVEVDVKSVIGRNECRRQYRLSEVRKEFIKRFAKKEKH